MEEKRTSTVNSNNINNNTHIRIADVPLISFGDLVAPRKDKNNRLSDMSVYTLNDEE